MIKIVDESVFGTPAECIVNTINCVGAMGKGLALEFSLRYPKLDKIYIEQCHKKQIKTGHVYFYEINKQKIINFPTKFHFAYPSKIEWIIEGLNDFLKQCKKFKIKSVAFPLLGCTNGGLDKKEVIQVMRNKLSSVDIPVYICLSKKPDQIENDMITAFNRLIDKKVNVLMLLKIKNSSNIKIQKITRFYELLNVEGIGYESYKRIYYFFFNKEYKNMPVIVSMLK